MLDLIVSRISDWLIALLVVTFIIWFGFYQPVFTSGNTFNASPVFKNSQKNLKDHVNQLSVIYAPRTIQYNNLNNTARYIHKHFAKLGQTEYQTYSTLNGQFSNVILHLGPKSDEVFVIGAHYDAKDNSLDTEGNASGIATLLELARQLALNENKLSLQVQLVAYPLSQIQNLSNKEMGSYHHAELLKDSGDQVKMMISLDSIGRFNNRAGSQHYPFSFMKYIYPDKGNYISLLGRIQDVASVRAIKNSFNKVAALPLYSINAPENFPRLAASDHRSYWANGFPGLLLTDTAEYRQIENPKADVVDRLDYENMAQIVHGLNQVVLDSHPYFASVRLVQQKNDPSTHLLPTLQRSSQKTPERIQ